jgi:hypothetical protein
MARSPSHERFVRSGPKYKEQPRVLVVCEDEKSVPTYLKEGLTRFRARAEVETPKQRDANSVIRYALSKASSFDQVYCVIDGDAIDDLGELNRTLKNAGAKGQKITLTISYPCFEFWLLLHFGYTRPVDLRTVGRKTADDRVCELLRTKPGMQTYDKGKLEKVFERLLPKLSDARTHAQRSVEEGKAEGQMNPSTTLHLLITEFERLGKPIPIEA